MNKYVVFQCGGAAPHTSLILLNDIIKKTNQKLEVICVDSDLKSAKVLGEYLGLQFYSQGEFLKKDNFNGYVILPVDQFIRMNYNLNGSQFLGSHFDNNKINIQIIHNKTKCYELLEKNKKTKHFLPKRFDRQQYIYRQNVSAGSKSLKKISFEEFFKNENFIVTEKIENAKQYVIDFKNEKQLIIYPRQTLCLKNGADTVVRVLSWRSDEYKILKQFVQKILEVTSYKGIGMIQCFIKDNKPIFIEMACRLSGSAYLNLDLFNYNPFNSYFGLNDNVVQVKEEVFYSNFFRRKLSF